METRDYGKCVDRKQPYNRASTQDRKKVCESLLFDGELSEAQTGEITEGYRAGLSADALKVYGIPKFSGVQMRKLRLAF